MKDVLTRRLTGAAVLLVVAFGLASLLPSPERPADGGSAAVPGQTRVVTYELKGGRPVGLRLDDNIEAPAADKSEGRVSKPPTRTQVPVTVPVKPDPTPERAPEPKAKAPEPPKPPPPAPEPQLTGGWSVQVASFADPDNARKTHERLKGQKLPAHVQEVHVGNAKWYRVRVGPYGSESKAKDALERVKALDFRGARLIEE